MKKVLLAVLLIALIAAVSYIKSYREDQKRLEAVEKISQEAAEESAALRDSVEIVQSALDRTLSSFEDSVSGLAEAHKKSRDSLQALLSANQEQVQTEQPEVIQADSADQKQEPPAIDSASLHRRILTYYRKRFKDLPSDLSDYERRVALSEIREETAHRFSITVGELNRMRKKHKLDY